MVFSDERNVTLVHNATEAQPLLDFLHDNGIEAHLCEADDFGGLNPALAFVHGTYITVPADQLAEAEGLVAAYRAAPIEPTPELDESASGRPL